MAVNIFLDTNLWVYLHADSVPQKQAIVRKLIVDDFETITISAQVLGELFNVLTKKQLTTPEKARAIVLEMAMTFPVLEIDTAKVITALDIHSQYGYSYWDSLILATAFLNNCQIVYSEDMHHNQLIESSLRIVNPFVANP
ncbi:MAG: PIN domain-containing protein [Anaerolineales bacterium]|nr:PIN domain-containing protein [Anaerolineales bacterium]MCB8983667.1 PIN domain-containing protein [Ardenticatenaceae bacterium]